MGAVYPSTKFGRKGSQIIRRQIGILINTMASTRTKEYHDGGAHKIKHYEYTLRLHINPFLHTPIQYRVKRKLSQSFQGKYSDSLSNESKPYFYAENLMTEINTGNIMATGIYN